MDSIIKLDNLHFHIQQKVIFKSGELDIPRGSFVAITGKSGSGKSTLLKLMVALIRSDNSIQIDGKILNEQNIPYIRSNIGFVFENPEFNIIADTVRDDILYSLPTVKYNKETIEKRLQEIAQYLDIENLLDKNTNQLSGGEKQLVSIAGALIRETKILILDNAFSMIDSVTKELILKKLKRLNKDKKITILLSTNDMDDTIFVTHILLLGEKTIKFFGKKNEAYMNEKIFLEEGIDMPFMVQLSNKLKYYGLTDRVIIDINKMVDELWK